MTGTLEKPAASTANMIRIPGGSFRMGSDRHYVEEAPAHTVAVDGFWIDPTPVTNAQFRKFVKATGHVTWAEIAPDAKDYPGALPHMLKAGGLVFTPPSRPVDLRDWSQWWSFTFGANWRRPYGKGSHIGGLDDHPEFEQVPDQRLARLAFKGPGQDVGVEEVPAFPRAHPRPGLRAAFHKTLRAEDPDRLAVGGAGHAELLGELDLPRQDIPRRVAAGQDRDAEGARHGAVDPPPGRGQRKVDVLATAVAPHAPAPIKSILRRFGIGKCGKTIKPSISLDPEMAGSA